MAQHHADELRRVVRGKAVLLAGGDGARHRLGEGGYAGQRQVAVVLQVGQQLVRVERGIAVEGGRVELDLADHAGAGFVGTAQIVHRSEVVELAFDAVGADGVGHLTGRMLVGLGQVGKHSAKQRHIHGLAAVQQLAGLFFHRIRRVGLGLFLRLLGLVVASRRACQVVPVAVDQGRKGCNLAGAQKQQVLGFPVVAELQPGCAQGQFDARACLGFVAVAKGVQLLQQHLQQLLGANAAVGIGDFTGTGRLQTDGALEALAANSRPPVAAEQRVLGCAGVVAVQVGRGEVLDQVVFDEQAHGVLLGVNQAAVPVTAVVVGGLVSARAGSATR